MATTYGSFYAINQGFGSGFFKIYVTDSALCGAKLAGSVYDENSARAITAQFGLLGWLIGKQIGKRAIAKREAKEREYDAMEAGGPVFMGTDKANFNLGVTGLQKVELSGKVGWLSKGTNACGVLQLQTSDGSKRKFLVVAAPEAPNIYGIQSVLGRLIPNVTLET